ncbi:hypothetical protein [uncultured Kordia sp.]|uniref:hypothetical protein n=1 Tax=uncultured Kordia sp. TaxID=507699 RepID=UPI00260FAD4D|nr:hypothetical protein [uncultured Kordia sp.]
MSTDYEELQEIALSAPGIRKLLEERKKIEADYHKDITYNKPDLVLKPINERSPAKTYTVNKSKDKKSREKHYENKLYENAKKIEKTVLDYCDKAHVGELKKDYKKIPIHELPTFIEKGWDEVLKERETKKHQKQEPRTLEQTQKDFKREILSFKSETTNDSFNNSQELMKNRIEDFKKSQNQEKLKEQNNKFDQAYEKLRESQYKENQKEIEHKRDRGFKR